MPGWLTEAMARLAATPWLQACLAAGATFILEDPTTIGCGLLVADGKMRYATALVGVFGGIALGDLGLYAIGHFMGPRVVARGWVSAERLERAATWFRHNLVSAVILSRFVPGLRLPTYVGAGVLRAPFFRFLAVVVGASLVWTVLLLSITVALGRAILPWLGRARWPLAIAALVLFVLLERRVSRRFDASSPFERKPRPASRFEFWSPWLFYIPVGLYYVWLAVRYRGLLLPASANPSIFSGGLIGESKSAILALVAPAERRWVAPWVVIDTASSRPLHETVNEALSLMEQAGIHFPIVAKPDVGQRGAGVRPVRSEAELDAYLSAFPRGRRLMLQRLACEAPAARASSDDIREAGVLYWREPGGERGRIFSITFKQVPVLIGDGERTVRELILSDERARRLADVYLARHEAIADRVLSRSERLPLVFAGNHCQGAIFTNGTARATPELLERIDGIARAMPEFYFGRFDVRFDDLEAFLRGEDLQIVEINGAGAEATHIWDASARLSEAYATLFEQFRILFAIGAANRKRGFSPIKTAEFLREARAYRRAAREYPSTH